jgi:hypothetical protein
MMIIGQEFEDVAFRSVGIVVRSLLPQIANRLSLVEHNDGVTSKLD